jgi:hypothetical protein
MCPDPKQLRATSRELRSAMAVGRSRCAHSDDATGPFFAPDHAAKAYTIAAIGVDRVSTPATRDVADELVLMQAFYPQDHKRSARSSRRPCTSTLCCLVRLSASREPRAAARVRSLAQSDPSPPLHPRSLPQYFSLGTSSSAVCSFLRLDRIDALGASRPPWRALLTARAAGAPFGQLGDGGGSGRRSLLVRL